MMRVNHQRPIQLPYELPVKMVGDMSLPFMIEHTIINDLLTPLHAGTPVEILDDNNQAIDPIVLTEQLTAVCASDAVNADAEDIWRSIFRQSLIHHHDEPSLLVKDIYANQAGASLKLPAPSMNIIYGVPTDVIPSAKKVLAKSGQPEEFFASLAFTFTPKTLGVGFSDETQFRAFIEWATPHVQAIQASMQPTAVSQWNKFRTTKMDLLLECLLLREELDEELEDYSFARILHTLVNKYAAYKRAQGEEHEFFMMPFHLTDTMLPRTISFVNVERHARATPRAISNEWELLNKALASPVKIYNRNALTKMVAVERAKQRAQANAHMTSSGSRKHEPDARAKRAPLRKTAPTLTDLTRMVLKVLNKMANVNRSNNSYKKVKMSFARPNRRDPDNFNLMGKVVSTRYKPDIHLYVDTSGSISERNYQDMIKACVKMAKKLNVNLYFNSFSHYMTSCTLLRTKDRSTAEIMKEIERLPKAFGGTDYNQIWRYIQASPKRRRELSLIITDFEYFPPNEACSHPRNLYYAPVSHFDWDTLRNNAQYFIRAMRHVDPNVRARMMM